MRVLLENTIFSLHKIIRNVGIIRIAPILLSKKVTKEEGGGHKIGKMGRRHLWMVPNGKCKISVIIEFVYLFASVLFGW